MSLKRAWSVVYWLPTAILVTNFYTLKLVSDRSMQPTLNPDSSLLWRDVGIFDRRAIYKLRHRRGDIITLKSPEDAKFELVKRVIALEGDTVRTLPPYPVPEVRVPEGHVWVEGLFVPCLILRYLTRREGDAFHSQDSNSFGAVPLGLVDSRLVCLIWPVWRLGWTDPATPNARVRVNPAPSKIQ
ncbi:peptidase S24/S26A/S26B/S26C [Mycena galopus ATCC 62051]|nr:peptidase S24/S26A/S26B/S26C [Mycena galopus ATCC 62051]